MLLTTQLREIFTEEVLEVFKSEIKKIKSGKTKRGMFTTNVISAYEDIIKCIDDESIKSIEDLDDYIEENYANNDSEHMIISFIIQFAEDDFEGTVSDIFKKGKSIDLDNILDDEDEEEFEEFFEGKY